jgi:hypothetical protein
MAGAVESAKVGNGDLAAARLAPEARAQRGLARDVEGDVEVELRNDCHCLVWQRRQPLAEGQVGGHMLFCTTHELAEHEVVT